MDWNIAQSGSLIQWHHLLSTQLFILCTYLNPQKKEETMTENEKWLTKQLTKTIELLDKLATEVSYIQKRLKKIENPDVEDLFNMKRGEPFNEGTD